MCAGSKKTYIIIVNWKGWADTIECLESVFRIRHKNYVVIVCDNGSKDDSIARLLEWANGRYLPSAAAVEMASYTHPPVPKPISVCLLGASEIDKKEVCDPAARLVIIDCERNLGFAGANNLGLRHVLSRADHDYVWLLNNDTVVHPGALTAMLERMESDLRIGICGSKLCFYSAPGLVQAYGGATYKPASGRNRHIGEFKAASVQENSAEVEKRLGYVIGACMLVSRRFLDCIGLMNEDYFIYYEELDWATRARGRFRLGYASQSVVYHKQGNSVGGKCLERKHQREEDFLLSDFYGIRNQIRFTRRYYPQYMPCVAVTVAGRLLKRIGAGKSKRVRSAVRGVISAFSGSLHDRLV